jgi:hypothetical protein
VTGVQTCALPISRAEAWDVAQDFVAAPDPARAIDRLDRRTALLARGIVHPLPPFGAAFEVVRSVEDQSVLARIIELIRGVEWRR